ncbi:hypothetical protein IGI04_043127 [Brassica rapa subsp. trilocularis]|uniref:Uncharacterized protein n=1 Tax=Brassica rapa subsp. trilocularis TaxID=1813537 RepID=A0ABQ7KJ45_BRACM|nr:hypothetical protein IGI04_043127 [Brassica rapa subsp. trilocularis]
MLIEFSKRYQSKTPDSPDGGKKQCRTVHRKCQQCYMCNDDEQDVRCVLTGRPCVLTDGLCVADGRPVCTDQTHGHTRTGRSLCVLTDVPVCADGRPSTSSVTELPVYGPNDVLCWFLLTSCLVLHLTSLRFRADTHDNHDTPLTSCRVLDVLPACAGGLLCVLKFVLCELTTTRTKGHPLTSCVRPCVPDGHIGTTGQDKERPCVCDGRTCVAERTATTSCVERRTSKISQTVPLMAAEICNDGQPDVWVVFWGGGGCVLTDGHGRPYSPTWAKITPDRQITREPKKCKNKYFVKKFSERKHQNCHKEFRMSKCLIKVAVDIRLDHETPTFVACKRHG